MSSPEATRSPATKSAHFTDGETKFLLSVLKHLKGGNLEFDKAAVAVELGMKDAGSVAARWNTINRTKIQANGEGAAGPTTPSSSKKAVKKRSPTDSGIEDDEEMQKTPSKKRGRKAKTEIVEDEVTIALKEEPAS